jgi:hypothetical protein
MSKTDVVRNEVSKLAQQIETLARQVQDSLAQGRDPIGLANELVRNSSTFVFTLGEMYALEESNKGSNKVKTTVVSNPNNTSARNYHNVRDSLGRFSRV